MELKLGELQQQPSRSILMISLQGMKNMNQYLIMIKQNFMYNTINILNLSLIKNGGLIQFPLIIQRNRNDGSQITVDQTQQSLDSQIYNQLKSGNDVGHLIPDNHHHQQQQQQSTELLQESQDSEIQRTQEIQNEVNSQQLDSSSQSDHSQSDVDDFILVQPPLSEQFRSLQNSQNQSSQQTAWNLLCGSFVSLINHLDSRYCIVVTYIYHENTTGLIKTIIIINSCTSVCFNVLLFNCANYSHFCASITFHYCSAVFATVRTYSVFLLPLVPFLARSRYSFDTTRSPNE
ncbi:unnamed protein product [Schistosoma margrebowiei]|uniref:Uncharacterized protein n=1 Tax=Schistosoma margrebowiei TaxID=48269 RepID=A0A183LRF2_9TREM|nr:unnamed protein product [Schistosoma margrebowiei]